MKLLLTLLIICFIAIAAKAQIESIYLQKLKTKPDYLQLFRNKKATAPNSNDSLINVVKSNLLLKGAKPGVYRLPQDGMPCIVPDTKDIAAIPNGWKGKVSGPYTSNEPRIPNPASTHNDLRFREKKWVPVTILPRTK